MYRKIIAGIGALLAAFLGVSVIAFPHAAGATSPVATLGLTTEPSGATGAGCSSFLFGQQMDDPTTPYRVPAADNGTIVQSWSSAVAGDTPGGTLTLWVLAPAGADYTVVGTDTETVPSPLPTSGVATFTVAAPIPVATDDTFALTASSGEVCAWTGGSTPAGDGLFRVTEPATTTAGETLVPTADSGGGYTLDLGVALAPGTEDASVSPAAQPASVTSGSLVLLTDTVANAGPGSAPLTLTDIVPSGLIVDTASVDGGTCTTVGQTVTCTIPSVASGASVPVYIVVTATGPGTDSNAVTVAVSSSVTDPAPANNAGTSVVTVTGVPTTTTTTVTQTVTTTTPVTQTVTTPVTQTVTAPVTQTVTAATPAVGQKCTVVGLTGTPQAVAKTILAALHCKVGKLKRAASRSIAKGDVIATTPGKGTFASGRAVSLTVSTGKPKSKSKPKRRPAPLR